MKTQEEIEYLAEKLYPISRNPKQIIEGFERVAFKKGYMQCQQDMDKKYTEEDLRKAIMVGIEFESGDYPEGFNYKLGMSIEDYFIKSLNK